MVINIKVKIFDYEDEIDLEEDINNFISSSNIEVISHANIQTATDNLAGFAYSDHDPATMTFKLKI